MNFKSLTKIGALVVMVLLASLGGLHYYNSFTTLSVSWADIDRVEVYEINSSKENQDSPPPVKTIHRSGDTVKLHKGRYFVYFIGDPGYESRYRPADLSDGPRVINFKPNYSDDHLRTQLKAELPTILSVLRNTLPALASYQVQEGQLYSRGEWYGTTLVYKGNDIFNSDTLRLVMHQVDGKWLLVTGQPNIGLSKFDYPDVPKAILSSVNNLQ